MLYRRLLLLTLSFCAMLFAHAQSGTLDPTFNPSDRVPGHILDNNVLAVAVQPDGKVLIAGTFTSYAGKVRNRIARLNADGTLDESFDPGNGPSAQVNCIALQADGKILIGGLFSTYDGTASSYLARLNSNGSRDAGFSIGSGITTPSQSSQVFAIAVQTDGKILVGGQFGLFNGNAANNLVRINSNGTYDNTYATSTGANNVVNAITLQADGKALIGGTFTSVNGTARTGVARINTNGATDGTFTNGTGATGGAVLAIRVQPNGSILIGGNFTSYNGTSRLRLARITSSGALDATFSTGNGVSSTVYAIGLQSDGKVIVGGQFTTINSTAVTGLARLSATGVLDVSFTPVGGLVSGAGLPQGHVRALHVYTDDRVLFGGPTTMYEDVLRWRLARLNSNGTIDFDFRAVTGFDFHVSRILPLASGKFLAIGTFTVYRGVIVRRIARINADGTLDNTFNPGGYGANGNILRFAVQPDGKILICGNFTKYNGVARNYIARLNADGSLDTGFDPGTGGNSDINALTLLPDGKVLITGTFTTFNGIARSRLARLNSNGSLDATWVPSYPNNYGYDLQVEADGKFFLSGDFTFVGGSARNRFARLNADGTVDTDFNSANGFDGRVTQVIRQADGKYVICGTFTAIGGAARKGVARITANGTLDAAFQTGSGPGGSIFNPLNMVQASNGKLFIAGWFTTFNGAPANRIICLTSDGSPDATFATGNGFDDVTEGLALQSDGQLLVGGSFRAFNDSTRNCLVRLLVADPISLSTGSVNTALCTSISNTVPFTITGSFNSGNVFTAQLSDASGSFASPVTIGTLTGTSSGTINVVIPAGTAPGSGYRIRVISSNPAVIGTDNGSNITITQAPSAGINYFNPPYCPSAGIVPVQLAGTSGGTFSATPAGLTIDAATGAINAATSAAGNYTVTYTIAASGGCPALQPKDYITINGSVSIDQPGSQTLCAGSKLTQFYSGNFQFVSYTNSDTSTGIPASGGGIFYEVPVRNNTNAPITSSITVTPRTPGSMAYVPIYGNNTLLFYDLVDQRVERTMPTGTTPVGVAVSPNGEMVYVTNTGSANVSVFSASTHNLVTTIPVGNQPYGVAVTPDNSRVYVANQGSSSVSVINTATNTVIATIAVPNANAIGINPSGTRVYVTSYSDRVYVINISTNTVAGSFLVGSAPEAIVFLPDGSRAYVTNQGTNNVSVINLATHTVMATLPVGVQPEGAVVSPDGSKLYVVNQGSDYVSIFNTATNALLDTVHVGYFPEGISLTQDGDIAMVTNVGGKSISVINTATNDVVRTIPTTFNPYGLGNFISPNSCFGESKTYTVTVHPSNAASVNYAPSYCTNAGTVTPQFSGAAGGTFSAVPAGLSIDNLGAINTATSQPGVYVITYSTPTNGGCEAFSVKDTISISSVISTSIRYAGSPYCPNQGTVAVTKIGSESGTFSASPAGLVIDPVSGAVNANTSQPGTYTVTFTLTNAPACGNATATAYVIISPLPTIDPQPNQTRCSGGTLTAPVTGTASIHDWINSDTAIGLPAVGSGMIWGWPVHNNTNAPITSTVTYIPRNTGNQAWVPLYNTNNVLLYDITSGNEWFRVPVGTRPLGVAVSPDGSRVYVTNNGSNSVSVIAPNNFGVVATIPVGNGPYGVVVSPDGSRVYVANQFSNNVSVINASTNTVIATVPVGGANAIAINPAGTKVYVSSYDNKVYIINTATNTVIKTVIVGGAPEGIDFTPDGSKVFIANQFSNDVTVMDGNADVVVATMLAGLQPEGVVVSKDGSKVYIVNQASNNVFIFNTSNYAFIDSIQVGSYPEGASLTQDGSQLFVTNVGGNSISVINTATNTVVKTIATGTNPYGLGNFISPIACSGPAQSFTVTVNPAPSATIDYSGSPYCNNGGTATVVQTGTAGGHYSASPAGLTLDATSGDINLVTSQPGTYVVTYTIDSTSVCSAFSTADTIVISAAVSATIDYAASPYCSNAGSIVPVRNGSAGGTYSALPAGLSIDASSGAVNSALSQAGTYVVTYSFPEDGPCGAFSTSDTIVITAAPSASIAYAGSPFCAGAGTAAVTFSGTSGGMFTATPAGLAIDSNTGSVNVNASAPGNYLVSYQVAASGGCALTTATNSIVISSVPVVAQPADAIVCAGVATAPVAFTGNYSPAAYYWTISDTTLGLPSSGYGSLPSFVPVNNSGTAIHATVTVTPITGLVYGAESSTNKRIAIINRATRQVIQRFATAQTGPSGIALTRDGSKLYTCNFENASVSVIDLATQTEITTIPASPSTYSMVLSPDETRLYVVGIANSNVTIINTQTNSVITRITVGGSPRGIAISPDGSKVFVACRNSNRVSVISTSSNTQIASVPVAGGPYALAVSPDGSQVYVSCAVGANLVSMSTNTYALTDVAAVGNGSAGIAISADGSRVYLAHSAPSGLRVIDPAAHTIVANISLPNYPVFVQLTPDGKEVYVNNQFDTSISVVNLETNTAIRVASMAFPSGMAATQDGICAGTPKTFTLTVNPAPSASIAYGASPYCSNAGVVDAIFSGTAGGSWTSSPAGLSIDSNTGRVQTAASQAGTYTVTYTVAAQSGCTAFSTTTQIAITAAPMAQIAYNQSSYCAGTGNVGVQLTGSTGGHFTSSPSGLSIDSLSGSINTVTSQAGTYTITYTVAAAGGCASFTTTTTVTILPAAIVSAVSNKAYCSDERSTLITFGGGSAGTTYEWTNDNTTIGVAASGSGSIAPFTAVSNGTTAAVANITVTPYLNGCSGTPITFTLTVNPLPSVNALSNQVACAGSNVAPIAFSGPVAGTTFSWTNSNPAIGLASAGNGTVPAFTAQNSGTTPLSAAIRVLASITANGLTCNGRTTVLTISVNPTPTVAAVGNQAVCNNTSTEAVAFSGTVPGTIFKWTNSNPSIGLAASGTGDIPAFTGLNNTTSVQTATITVTPQFFGGTLCSGSPVSFTISVQPDLAGTTSFSYSASPYCINAGSIAPDFTGVAGGRFTASPAGLSIDSTSGAVNTMLSQPGSYTVNYTISGLGGNCNQVSSTSVTIIPATTAAISYAASPYCATGTALVQRSGNAGGYFTASPAGLSIDSLSGTINLSASQAGNYTITYTVTAPGSGCSTVQATASITVNPVPSVNSVSNQVLCNGSNSTPISFSGPVAGTTFAWTNNNTSIGLAASGGNSVPAFTASNGGTTTQQATIRVTPTSPNGAGVCTGAANIVMILVNPVATVNPVASQMVCAGTATQAVAFTGAVAGSTFRWTNSNPAIGLAAMGTGDIVPFAAQNNTAGPISATITVTPQSNGGGVACSGAPVSFTITVQPFTSGTSISYAASPYCAAAGPVAPSISGSTGGRFSGPAGLALDTISGVINPSMSTPGIYTVNYVVANGGLCPQFASTTVSIIAAPSASISYAASPYCQSGTANAVRNGSAGGTFSASPAGLTINASTGAVALVSSAAGTYTVTYTVSSGSGCAPFTTSTTITVAPTPTVNPVSNQVWCNGNNTTAVNFTGTAPGTVYNWTNSAPSIGLAASGSGNIASFVAVNNSGAQIRATISVTPALSNGSSSCPGRTVTFNISVNPTPTVTPVANQSVCKGSGTQQVTLSGPVAGTTYSWTNNNTMIGLNATGTNTVPAFVAQNPTANPIAGTVTITPNYLNGVRCFGPAITYTYTVQNCAPRLVTKGAAELPAVEKELAELVTVGPNPTPTGLLYIYYSGDASRRLSYVLTDAQGRMLHTAALQGSRTQVDLRGYAAGSYLLQVRDAQTGASVKQVILRP